MFYLTKKIKIDIMFADLYHLISGAVLRIGDIDGVPMPSPHGHKALGKPLLRQI